MARFYDREGKPLSVKKWITLLDTPEYGKVRVTLIGRTIISTIWVGLAVDHPCVDKFQETTAEPLIFETQVRDDRGTTVTGKYPSRERAEAGHDNQVQIIRHELLTFGRSADYEEL